MTKTWLTALMIGVGLGAAAPTVAWSAEGPAAGAKTPATVFKSPTCGCCAKWEEHLRANGFEVRSVADAAELQQQKKEHGVKPELQSCHTAIIEGYVIEGHVPADVIRDFLKQKPKGAIGLAAPGMPVGSPGMEGADPDRYDILSFDRQGRTTVFATRGPAKPASR
jgi:hypothetical protein